MGEDLPSIDVKRYNIGLINNSLIYNIKTKDQLEKFLSIMFKHCMSILNATPISGGSSVPLIQENIDRFVPIIMDYVKDLNKKKGSNYNLYLFIDSYGKIRLYFYKSITDYAHSRSGDIKFYEIDDINNGSAIKWKVQK